MSADEAGTLAALKSRRREVLDPLIARHGGRLFKLIGDGALVEFGSAVNAVQCAVALQDAFAVANADIGEAKRIVLRIGVHLGDVMVEGSDLYGDGINIAARLEGLAEPGGVLVSEDVHRQVRNKLSLAFDDIGLQNLKNIAQPVRAFRTVVSPSQLTPNSADVVAGSIDKKAELSIAILPFSNMSTDREQDYFSDGITEDIITELSRFRELRVIARNSSFAFRGQNTEIAEIARRLNVQFVMEGSVRKAGARLRITAQLIEVGTDRHIWAERYDRDLDDVFAIQDEIAHTVASLCAGHVKFAAAARAKVRPTDSLSAYDLVLHVRSLLVRHNDKKEEEVLLAKAIALDPGYAMALALMANNLNAQSDYDGDLERRERAAQFARRAIQADPNEPWGHGVLGYCLTFLRRLPEAGVHFDRAAELNPNDTYMTMMHASWLVYTGETERALARMQYALTRDPLAHDWFWEAYSWALVVAGKFREALIAFEKMALPPPWGYVSAAIAHVNLGNLDRARGLLLRCQEANPQMAPEDYVRQEPYVDPAVPKRLIADLRKAL